jgi:hypothetical protein
MISVINKDVNRHLKGDIVTDFPAMKAALKDIKRILLFAIAKGLVQALGPQAFVETEVTTS